MVSRQRGKAALVVLAVVLSIGALALLFYVNSKEEESVRQSLDPDAAAAKSREREAKVQALEERKQNFERQAEELQQKRAQSWNERKARQHRPEQEVQKKE
jgi:Flp pilus assembly protein TadB